MSSILGVLRGTRAQKITPYGVTTNQAYRPGLNARQLYRLRMPENLHGHDSPGFPVPLCINKKGRFAAGPSCFDLLTMIGLERRAPAEVSDQAGSEAAEQQGARRMDGGDHVVIAIGAERVVKRREGPIAGFCEDHSPRVRIRCVAPYDHVAVGRGEDEIQGRVWNDRHGVPEHIDPIARRAYGASTGELRAA
jgi:hypothetical protein